MNITIFKIADVLVTRIPPHLNDMEAEELQRELLEELFRTEAQGLIIDVNNTDIIDSYMARILTDLAASAQMMGVKVVISGIRPDVAITLVEMGRAIEHADTTLELTRAMKRFFDLTRINPDAY
jgi:rsbT antagonist protein RsbS